MIARMLAFLNPAAHPDRACADPVLADVAAAGQSASSGIRAKRALRRLAAAQSGVALTEFAFVAPLVLSMGMMGSETAYYTITHMQISQIAMQVADDASRVGETDVLNAREVTESDINSSLVGAEKAGASYNVYDQGRIIISSLQQNADGGQWIAWQRCRGAKVYDSSYGAAGEGATGTDFAGMGEAGSEITAAPGTAVMFVEIAYDYESLTPFNWLDGNEIVYTAAFNVRDQRDLGGNPGDPRDPDGDGLHQTTPASGVAACNVYSAARP